MHCYFSLVSFKILILQKSHNQSSPDRSGNPGIAKNK